MTQVIDYLTYFNNSRTTDCGAGIWVPSSPSSRLSMLLRPRRPALTDSPSAQAVVHFSPVAKAARRAGRATSATPRSALWAHISRDAAICRPELVSHAQISLRETTCTPGAGENWRRTVRKKSGLRAQGFPPRSALQAPHQLILHCPLPAANLVSHRRRSNGGFSNSCNYTAQRCGAGGATVPRSALAIPCPAAIRREPRPCSSRAPAPPAPPRSACGNPISFYALPADAGEDNSTLITAVLPIKLTGLGPWAWPRNLSNNPDAYYNRAPPAFTVRGRGAAGRGPGGVRGRSRRGSARAGCERWCRRWLAGGTHRSCTGAQPLTSAAPPVATPSLSLPQQGSIFQVYNKENVTMCAETSQPLGHTHGCHLTWRARFDQVLSGCCPRPPPCRLLPLPLPLLAGSSPTSPSTSTTTRTC